MFPGCIRLYTVTEIDEASSAYSGDGVRIGAAHTVDKMKKRVVQLRMANLETYVTLILRY